MSDFNDDLNLNKNVSAIVFALFFLFTSHVGVIICLVCWSFAT